MAWKDYAKLTDRQRRMLYSRARKGDEDAKSVLTTFSRQLANAANRRLLELEKAGYNYYKAYNSASYYLFTEFEGARRFKQPKYFKGDIDEMELQNKQALKFLESSLSTVKGVKEAEKRRVTILMERNIITTDLLKRKENGEEFAIDFLRFLGQEEVSSVIDEYGTSDIVVDYLWKSYSKGTATSLILKALDEFLDSQITFDEAMERIGVKVEDYISGEPTS